MLRFAHPSQHSFDQDFPVRTWCAAAAPMAWSPPGVRLTLVSVEAGHGRQFEAVFTADGQPESVLRRLRWSDPPEHMYARAHPIAPRVTSCPFAEARCVLPDPVDVPHTTGAQMPFSRAPVCPPCVRVRCNRTVGASCLMADVCQGVDGCIRTSAQVCRVPRHTDGVVTACARAIKPIRAAAARLVCPT